MNAMANIMDNYLSWDALARAFGAPVLRAAFKQEPGDFAVTELLGFEPDGAGEHLLVEIEKTGLTTFDAQSLLARHFGVALRDTAFAGMKDKQGVTRQWFSLPACGDAEVALANFAHPQLRVLRGGRNSRKLRRGSHKGNAFRIVLRNVAGDHDAIHARIATLQQRGAPNYFGAQRFGHGEANVPAALAWLRGESTPGRAQRSLLLSAARSYLFNVQLARRVQEGSWDGWIDGDLMMLAGTASVFASNRATADELSHRLAAFDLHATGPLWGKGSLRVGGMALSQEQLLAEQYPALCSGLAAQGLEQERRALRVQVENLVAAFDDDSLLLEFTLTRGAYATSVLRELMPGEGA